MSQRRIRSKDLNDPCIQRVRIVIIETQTHDHAALQLFAYSACSLSICIAPPAAHAQPPAPFVPKDQFGEPPNDAWNYLPNAGQVHDLDGNFRDDVRFHSVGTYPGLYMMKQNRIAIVVPDDGSVSRVDLAFIGPGAKNPEPFLWEPTGTRYNFYEQNIPTGVENVLGGKRVIYEEAYDDIDIHVYSNKWGPKLYIVIKPGGNPNDLRIGWYGHDSLKIDTDEYLKVWFGQKFLKLTQGLAYQQMGSNVVAIPWVANYSVDDIGGSTGFNFGTYNPDLPLILMVRPFNPDIELGGGGPEPPEWCTFLAGAQDDAINAVTHDPENYLYFTGSSKSGATGQLPVTQGAAQSFFGGNTDAIIGRFNPQYEINIPECGGWMTYLGGGDIDFGSALAHSTTTNRVTVVGGTGSAMTQLINVPFENNPNSYQRTNVILAGFVAFFDAETGVKKYISRTVGNVSLYDDTDVAVDSQGNSYVVGAGCLACVGFGAEAATAPSGSYLQTVNPETSGTSFLSQGYAMRLSPTGTLTWFSPIGGPGDDFMKACAVDPLDRWLYVAGSTASLDSPWPNTCTAEASAYEYPLCRFENGFLQELLNGAGTDVPPNQYDDGMIMRFRLSDMSMDWSTYFGGYMSDAISDIVVAPNGNVIISGIANTPFYSDTPCGSSIQESGFPACYANGFFIGTGNNRRQFIAMFDDDTKLVWSTKIGDTYAQGGEERRSKLAVDEDNNVYWTGTTMNSNAGYSAPVPPTSSPAYYFNGTHNDAGLGLRSDAYVVRFNTGTVEQYATFFGGLGFDESRGITASSDRLYLCGRTYSLLNFPTHEPSIPGYDPYLNETPQAVLNQKADGFLAQLKYDYTIGLRDQPGYRPIGDLLLYPNPASDRVTLQFPAHWLGPVQVIVTDAIGRVVHQANASGSQSVLDTRHFAQGAYDVRVVNENDHRQGKLILLP